MSRSIALALDELVPAAQFFGSLTDDDQAAYEAIEWQDTRSRPSWAQVVAQRDRMPTRAELLAGVNAKRDGIIANGYRHPFGGTIGTRILDQRGPEDVTSWLALKLMAQDLNSSDQGDTLLPIRDARNETFRAKSTAVEAAMSDMGTWRAQVLAYSWALKDAIEAAPDQAALAAIDINAGWPE